MAIAAPEADGVRVCLYNPQSFNGSQADTRVGVLHLDLRPASLDGIAPPQLALVIAEAIAVELHRLYDRPKAPAPPDGGHGGEQVEGQLRLDLLE